MLVFFTFYTVNATDSILSPPSFFVDDSRVFGLCWVNANVWLPADQGFPKTLRTFNSYWLVAPYDVAVGEEFFFSLFTSIWRHGGGGDLGGGRHFSGKGD